MAPTYLITLTHFLNFLTAYTHTILHLRHLYPPSSFLRSKFHNTPVFQSRHPALCAWISDAVAAVRQELLNGAVARIAVVIYHVPTEGGKTGQAKVIERYMLDVSHFPVVSKAEREMELVYDGSDTEQDPDETVDTLPTSKAKGKEKAKPLDEDVDVDLSEQFRAALVVLTTRCSQLAPLPPNCSFNISLELKDEADADPPVGHPQAWIPVQPSLQKTGRGRTLNPTVEDEGGAEGGRREGADLGGVKTTPIRAVEAGVLRFETWVEEARAKYDIQGDDSQG
ncbi:DNA-binding protein [Delitschia confertaspora ATCC 74209]|uniref:DNA-binding protein n=1 Tax=Delitschia confertaspora ATCC 74209 TaxID=1513339 RepID=A0A9P4N2J7_9PLEO|nr:DNA-binding protein [Delitschia confertaspora ATCC 74209]